jgi:hypothetical protein
MDFGLLNRWISYIQDMNMDLLQLMFFTLCIYLYRHRHTSYLIGIFSKLEMDIWWWYFRRVRSLGVRCVQWPPLFVAPEKNRRKKNSIIICTKSESHESRFLGSITSYGMYAIRKKKIKMFRYILISRMISIPYFAYFLSVCTLHLYL